MEPGIKHASRNWPRNRVFQVMVAGACRYRGAIEANAGTRQDHRAKVVHASWTFNLDCSPRSSQQLPATPDAPSNDECICGPGTETRGLLVSLIGTPPSLLPTKAQSTSPAHLDAPARCRRWALYALLSCYPHHSLAVSPVEGLPSAGCCGCVVPAALLVQTSGRRLRPL
jgi:hypothetical protein